MNIRILRLEIEGMGPFKEPATYEIGSSNRVFIFAPNSRGKTPTLDLVRWLLIGDEIEQSDLLALERNGLLNWDTHYAKGTGRVGAELEVENAGQYRVTRSLRAGAPRSTLVLEEKDPKTGQFEPLGGGESWLRQHFPRERIGFNLLAGEHIEKFQDQLSGKLVKQSMEKLLQFPHLATASKSLARLSQSAEKLANKETSKAERASNASLRATTLKEDQSLIKQKIVATRERHDGLKRELAQLDMQVGSLRQASVVKDELARLARSAKSYEQQAVEHREELQKLLDSAWRPIAAYAGLPKVQDLIGAKESYTTAYNAWSKNRGQIEILEKALGSDSCTVCLSNMDANARKRIEAAVEQLKADEPRPPASGALTDDALRDWKYAANRDLVKLRNGLDHTRKYLKDAEQNLANVTEHQEKLMESLDDEASSKYHKIRRERDKVSATIQTLEDEIARDQEALEETKRELLKVRSSHAPIGNADKVSAFAKTAAAYALAFRETIDAALPWYRDTMENRVQQIFGSLYRKNPDAEVRFADGTYTPDIYAPDDSGKMVPIAVGESEKARLGLSLLLAFREVASETPFLLLDAVFSTADQEVVQDMLAALGQSKSQIIVLNKDRYTDTQFSEVERMRPKVYEMIWNATPNSKRAAGHTTVASCNITGLKLSAKELPA